MQVEEGAVLYLVGSLGKGTQQRVCGVAKLKTLEYRVYRKMREKLKGYMRLLKRFLQSKKGWKGKKKHASNTPRPEQASTISLFKKEVDELALGFKLPRPIEFYLAVLMESLDFIDRSFHLKQKLPMIAGEFITFISLCLEALEKGVPLTLSAFPKDSSTKLPERPWSTFSTESILKNAKKLVPSLGAQKETPEKLEEQTKNLVVLVPISIPGSGKSFLVETLRGIIEKKGMKFSVVSSDSIRKEVTDNLKKRNPKTTEEKAFQNSSKDAARIYEETVRRIVRATEKAKEKTHVVFLDKNHPPNGIQKAVNTVKSECPRNCRLFLHALVPKCEIPFSNCKRKVFYPFSLEFLLTCLHRIQNRTNHQNLQGKTTKTLNVGLMFFNMFRNVELDISWLRSFGFDDCFAQLTCKESPDFSMEEGRLEKASRITPELKMAVENAVYGGLPGEMSKDERVLEALLVEMEKANFQALDPEPAEFLKSIEEIVDKIQKGLEITKEATRMEEEEEKRHEGWVLVGPKSEDSKKPKEMSLEETKTGEESQLSPFEMVKKKTNRVHNKDPNGYNPYHAPLFLSIQAKNDEKTRIQKLFVGSLLFLQEKLPDQAIKEEIRSLEFGGIGGYSYPATFHITTLFIGGSKPKKQSSIFKNFEENIEFWFTIELVVIVPGHIVTGIVFPDRSLIDIENQFPHMTMLIQKLQAKYSNEVLKALFLDQNAPLHKEYPEELQKREPFAEKHSIILEVEARKGKKGPVEKTKTRLDAYIVKLKSPLLIPAATAAHY